ncbi:MAG: GNAT family N-acetyltransferase [Ruminococcaceae bacterium]|nr:GNAT family N-acetyltransferase [Oscillospiraceae bacterium]
MGIAVRTYTDSDLEALCAIWNSVVEDGRSFPQEEGMDLAQARQFFAGQSHTGVAEEDGEVLGLYILHPNNVGCCGHIANASYAVKKNLRGRRIGERLVSDSLEKAAALGFKILQFNAVVAENTGAIHLYKKLGFTQLGTVPAGFKLIDGTYSDILLFYKTL